GTASAGRMQQDLDKIAGMFVKVLPVRYAVSTDMNFADFVKHIKKCLLQAASKEVYDISNIVSEINKNRATPVERLYDATFAFLNFINEAPEDASEQLVIYDFEQTTSKLPLSLIASEHPKHFGFRIQYSTAHFTRSDMEMLVKQFQSLAENAAQNMDAKITDLIGGNEVIPDLMEDDISFNM
ncbi:MAG TPA: condensation domain-containing protein, partial [Chitinophagaceae bacterium]|nr:condensation domain-containing protein [Chitinophagaceae bacterium]